MKKIFVIEDDTAIRDAVVLILMDEGYHVIASASSAILAGLTPTTLPDLFIFDVFLSGENGITLGQQMQHAVLTKDVPVLIISARSDEEKKASVVGLSNFLHKPFSMYTLLEKVHSLI